MLTATVDSGAVLSVHIQDTPHADGRTRIEIAGTEGDLVIVSERNEPGVIQMNELRLRGSRGPGRVLADLVVADPGHFSDLTPEARNVARFYARLAEDFRNGTCTVPDFETGLRMHRLLDAIRHSAETGRRVRTDAPADR
ncbi:hypothetical protein GFY24_20430 [Nocardia sp. SYP-A9097]|nr:hypothetical protein [Nocardia sp. SYP-A9097]